MEHELKSGLPQDKPEECNAPKHSDSILIINDNQAERGATVQLLQRAGYEAREAANDAEALQEVLQAPPNLIILDAKLPRGPGHEFLRQIKAAPQTAHIPVLHISTSHDNDASVVAGLEAGADSCLTQPVEPIVLLATCRSLLRLAKAERLAAYALYLSEQRASEAELGRRLAETLNAEVNHRVKNNLMMVASLLQIQSAAVDIDQKAARVLQETTARVMAFARIHEQLQTEAEGRVNLLQMVHQLTIMVKEMAAEKHIHLEVEGKPVFLDAESAIHLAMIANELLFNAAKHGAPSPSGKLHIRVELEAHEGTLRLAVWNSGPLRPHDIIERQPDRLGLQLVRGLIAQHRGRFALKLHKGGYLAEVVMDTPKLSGYAVSATGEFPG